MSALSCDSDIADDLRTYLRLTIATAVARLCDILPHRTGHGQCSGTLNSTTEVELRGTMVWVDGS